MSNEFEQLQNLIDFIKAQTFDLGVEGFWEWLAEQDDDFRELILDVMASPTFSLRPHQIMPAINAQAYHVQPTDIIRSYEDWKVQPRVPQYGANGAPLIWRKWFLRMGRGAGKTHAAATNVHHFARYVYPGGDGILVGPDHKHVREVMIEGDSGLIATAPPDFVPVYQPGYSRIVWPNGSRAVIYTADDPETIRGPTVYWGWGDELAKWKSEESYENLKRTLRNKHPHGNRLILTTSPRSSQKWVRAIETLPDTITHVATSLDNTEGLDSGALAEYQRDIDSGSKKAREEYLAEWLDEQTKLWTLQGLDAISIQQQNVSLADLCEQMDRLLLSIDPGGVRDETGIVLLGQQGNRYWVLGDFTMSGTNSQWQAEVVKIVSTYMKKGGYVLVETNRNNGLDDDMRALLKGHNVHVKGVHQPPGQGKIVRAERAHQLYEGGQVQHFRIFPELHKQMDEFYEVVADKKRSPDRVDALCTGLNWFMDNKPAAFRILQLPFQVRFDH